MANEVNAETLTPQDSEVTTEAIKANSVSEEEANKAVDSLIRFYSERGSSLIIISGLGGVVHMSGNRFELEKLLAWQTETVQRANSAVLDNTFAKSEKQ